jgi:hypothetical protein
MGTCYHSQSSRGYFLKPHVEHLLRSYKKVLGFRTLRCLIAGFAYA